ncbi:lysophospholipid acyltransferase family protein, partial [Gammaproteobacteria bacterium]|nr:lysophospholipid acyltransferase family protein [Gammaproteobacteria bacterium]
QCLPALDKQQQIQIAQASIKETVKFGVENIKFLSWRTDKVLRRIQKITGMELLERAVQDKQGVILITPHIGNWELIPLLLPKKIMLTCLYKPNSNPLLDRVICNSRCRNGAKLAQTNNKGVRQLFKALNKQQAILILPDQNPDTNSSSVNVPFFNFTIPTSDLVARLMQKTNAKILFITAIRENQHFNINICQPTEPLLGTAEQIMQAINLNLELYIRNNPEQYQWSYNRFKTAIANKII